MRSRLADYLKTTDVEATLVGCDTATPTVARAAATLGVSASAIVKSIVLEHRQEPRVTSQSGYGAGGGPLAVGPCFGLTRVLPLHACATSS